MDNRDKILELLSRKGYMLPLEVAKEIGTNSLISSAMLSELVSNKKVLVSNTKVGSSPVYYLPGKEAMLQNLYKNLGEKERKGFDILKDVKVVRDNAVEPLLRAVLRQIKDFAKPFEFEINGQKELFWRWYIIPVQEAEQLVRDKLKPAEPKIEEKPEVKIEVPKVEEKIEAKPENEVNKEIKKLEVKEELKPSPEVKKEIQKTVEAKPDEEVKAAKKKSKKAKDLEEEFAKKLYKFFSDNKIGIVERFDIKNKSLDCVIKMSSAIGNIEYYCSAKDKKRVTDGDVSSAFVQAQLRKLPALLIITGDVTKKAKEMIEKGFKGVTIKKI